MVLDGHIKNIFEEGELVQKMVYAKFAHTTKHGAIRGGFLRKNGIFYFPKVTTLFLLLLSVTLFSCESPQSTEDNKMPELKNNIDFNFPTQFYGNWINKCYLDSLKSTKSAKKSQNYSELSLLSLFDNNDSIFLSRIWNFHEGGYSVGLKMINDSEATYLSSQDSPEGFRLTFNSNNSLIIHFNNENVEFEKYGKGTPYKTEMGKINEALISDIYILPNGNKIEFKNNGKILGLKEFNNYEINIDYIDAGMQYDKIDLAIDKNLKQTFGFVFSNDTFEIFNLGCKTYDENDSTFCVELLKGEAKYTLVKSR